MVGATTASAAHVVRYVSKHPLPKKIGRGFCYITVPHVHDYEPSDPRLYRQMDGQYYFVGDPAPYDYEGPRYSYYGAHPIADVDVHFGSPTYCYLRGPHYHWYSPPPQMQFELKGGAYWFVGNYEPVYYSERPRYVVINDVYAPVVYTRPVVDIRVAPPAFHGEIVAVGPVVGARAIVGGPVVSARRLRGGAAAAGRSRRRRRRRRHGWLMAGRPASSSATTTAATTAGTRTGAARPRPSRAAGVARPRRAARTAGWRGTPPPPSGGRLARLAAAGRLRPAHGGGLARLAPEAEGSLMQRRALVAIAAAGIGIARIVVAVACSKKEGARRRWSRAPRVRRRPSTSTARPTPMRRSRRGRAPASAPKVSRR